MTLEGDISAFVSQPLWHQARRLRQREEHCKITTPSSSWDVLYSQHTNNQTPFVMLQTLANNDYQEIILPFLLILYEAHTTLSSKKQCLVSDADFNSM